MFYFFQRGEQFVRCELRKDGPGYQLVIGREDGTEVVEEYDTDAQLTERWAELQRGLLREGWFGPHGRE